MAKIVWDAVGEHLYETGVRNCVLYLRDNTGAYPTGVAWNGITAINENPSGADEQALYADDIKYLSLRSAEVFGATVEAYTYPDEFAVCDGSATPATGIAVGQQVRKAFGLCYRTTIGNDVDFENHGYKLHLIYNATAAPAQKNYQTINETPEAITFSWELATTPTVIASEATTPVDYSALKPTAHIEIDSTKADPTKLAALEAILYGTDGSPGTTASLPLPGAVLDMFQS